MNEMQEIIEHMKWLDEQCRESGVQGISRRRYVYNEISILIFNVRLTEAERTAIMEEMREVLTK